MFFHEYLQNDVPTNMIKVHSYPGSAASPKGSSIPENMKDVFILEKYKKQ